MKNLKVYLVILTIIFNFFVSFGTTFADPKDDPVNLPTNEQVKPSDNTTYNLLAPLPGLKSIETNDIGKYFNILFNIAIGICGVLAVIMLIIHGISYMTSESFTEKAELKKKIWGPIGGLLLALGAYAILNTIDPALTGSEGLSVDQVEAAIEVRDRADDIRFIENIDSFNSSEINANISDYTDSTFVGYMAHQQGVAGAAAIFWSAKKGYAEVPSINPFVKGDINKNMRSNFNKKSAQKTIGTTTLTPVNFLKYWSKKVGAVKKSVVGGYKISQNIIDALNKASTETGMDITTLKTMCVIESSCNLTTQAKTGTYLGLFAISNDVFKNYGKGGDILDPYSNAFAACKLFKSSFDALSKKLSKI